MRTATVFFGLVIAAGCHHPPGLIMTPRREATLLELASKTLSCPRGEMEVQFNGSIDKDFHLYRVNGCEKHFEAIMACRVGRSGHSGRCLWLDLPDRYAALDLNCPPPNEIHRSYLGDRRFGVTGCGRSTSYTNADGRWLGEARPTPEAEPAAPPASPDDAE